jgi:hypothetical protein
MRHYIPYVNNHPLFMKAYESAKHSSRVVVIDNRDQSKRPLEPYPANSHTMYVKRPDVHLSTAQVMNYMLQDSLGLPYFTWQHSDVWFEPRILDEFLHYVASRSGHDWGIIYTTHDLLAAYNTTALREIGGWDALRFPWYFLDNDIAIRLQTAGYKLVQAPNFGTIHHEYSNTIRYDSERNQINSVMFPASELLFKMKHPNPPQINLVGDYN